MGSREGGSRGARGDEGRGPVTPKELEDTIRQIAGVQYARVSLGPGPRITEVHVIASQERGAKQIVRDVQTALLARYGIDIDYRIVSVVQLSEGDAAVAPAEVRLPDAPAASTGPRPALTRVAAESDGIVATVAVDVRVEGAGASGSARGPATATPRLVAQATVDAVAKLIGDAAVEVDAADVVALGPHRVAVAVLRVVGSRGEQVLSGSAVVRRDANDAVARAALDAVNRSLKTPFLPPAD